MDHRECSLEDAREALQFVSPEDRDTWVEMAFAVKSEFGELGFDVWDEWSQGGESYRAGDARSVWRSAKPGGATGSVGIGTLFKRAKDNGYQFREIDAETAQRLRAEAAERAVIRQREAAVERQRLEAMQQRTAAICQQLWAEYLSETGESRYLQDKQVSAHGVRFGARSVVLCSWPEDGRVELFDGAALDQFYRDLRAMPADAERDFSFRHIKPGVMVVPLRDAAGTLWSVQIIYPTGKKSFPKRCRKQGLFHLLGDPPAPSGAEVLWFAEGYSTAATVHQATGQPVAMTVDSGNLVPVARALREVYPAVQFAFAADDDRETKGNPGVAKAREAAAVAGGVVVVPDFAGVAA